MMDQARIDLFQQALLAAVKLERDQPGYPPFISIHNQLLYLLDLETGRSADRTKLDQINIGYITMREVETKNEAIAELFYKVSAEVKRMQRSP
jgi:hypothetical protein